VASASGCVRGGVGIGVRACVRRSVGSGVGEVSRLHRQQSQRKMRHRCWEKCRHQSPGTCWGNRGCVGGVALLVVVG